LRELSAMRVNELEPGKHHQGRYLSVRVKSSTSVAADIEAVDEYGERVILYVPHLNPLAQSEESMPVDSILFVKEPFTCETQLAKRPLSVNVVHISNIVRYADVDKHLPASWRSDYTYPGKTA
jgi:hypothetical protein